MGKTFIVPVDGSEHSVKALKYALDIAEETNSDILLVNVQPSYQNVHYVKRFIKESQLAEYREMMAKEVFEKMEPHIKDAKVNIEKKMLIGLPEKEIIKAAEELPGCTGIIMGSRGLGMMKSKVLGSVSYSVLHESSCPVTIVP
ncbi:nucleotide-binding universal stress UspA family protein [Melghiribacillus thermohalophilus]|uniref:Nucleotide-binding universal stress UspA family protein n=1 Tax=Melghiribacillus thermohalophilus TaxID=1324956 RepID=A0A4R3MYG1_9BACI|nr:universal stress protein [Melghiribacillus thermohalophilus]TCT20877.1 nucleotide-binding universal stress UspA family protein [Melghiribacillus thermohalophilus]